MPASKQSVVFVVVPNWNGIRLVGQTALRRCFASLLDQNLKPSVIVVDNGSTDGSVDWLQTHYPQIKVITLDRNYGFAGGVNRGFEAALKQNPKYVVAFNNDAWANQDWLKQLVRRANQDRTIGIVTSKLLQAANHKQLDSAGEGYSIWGLPFPRGRDAIDRGQYDELNKQAVLAATGGASLYRAAMLRQVGLFDEAFFAYYEDVDLSLRAQLAGWGVAYEPKAQAYHLIGRSSAKLPDLMAYHPLKNLYPLYLKNMPGVLFWKYLPRFIVTMTVYNLNELRKGHWLAVVKAASLNLLRNPKIIWQRWQIQRRRHLSIATFDQLLTHVIPPNTPLSKLSSRLRKSATS